MNYIRHLHAFYHHIRRDNRLSANHVSLYLALFQSWNYNRFQNPFRVNRETLMQLSKIGSKNTYHKCMKDLHSYQYIFYHTVIVKYQPAKVSMIRLEIKTTENDLQQLGLFNINTDTTQVPLLTEASIKSGTEPVPELGHLLKHKQINNKQERRIDSPTQINSIQDNSVFRNPNDPDRVPNSVLNTNEMIPSILEVEDYFQKNSYAILEAKKFFNHYQSNGWLVGGKTPMKNWQSSASKWMLNIENFKKVQHAKSGKQQINNLDTGPGKNYSEPL